MFRVNPTVSNDEPGKSQDLVLSGIPYPSAVVCNNAGAAFVASWVSPSAVAAVSWGVGDAIALKSEITQLPPACGGVLTMKYSTTLKLLVAACGKSPASIVAIQVDDSDSLERGCTLTPGETVLVDGEAGREARGLALYNYDDRHFAVVGLTDGTIVKFSLPELAVVEKRHIDARNLAHFSVGNADHTLTLLMFSPFPWRRLVTMQLDSSLETATVTSIPLEQDLEFVVDTYVDPKTALAFVFGNSQRGVPAVMQMDINFPREIWGIILAGVCNTESYSFEEYTWSWCEWGPKGRYAKAAVVDLDGSGTRSARIYIALTAQYCVHCQDWENENSHRCKDGKLEEDYYDDKSFCQHETWNQRQKVNNGDLPLGMVDQLSGKAFGGENISVAIMQIGDIPKVGGVSAAPRRRGFPSPLAPLLCVCALLLLGLRR